MELFMTLTFSATVVDHIINFSAAFCNNTLQSDQVWLAVASEVQT